MFQRWKFNQKQNKNGNSHAENFGIKYNQDMNPKEEEKNKGFICINCKKWVPISKYDNTVNRNHCPYCLWSKHVDHATAGDRMSSCNSGMKPIGLTIKNPRVNKWEMKIKGELMLIHECLSCRKISINRILAQDDEKEIMNVFENGIKLDSKKKGQLKEQEVTVLEERDREEVEKQIFGLKNMPRANFFQTTQL